MADEKDAFVPQARDQFVPQSGIAREDVAVAVNFGADAPRFAVAAQPASANLQRAQTFLQTFLERAANGKRGIGRVAQCHTRVGCAAHSFAC